MSLNELRAIGPSDEIQEVVKSPIPGEIGDSGSAMKDEGGLPGMEGGAPPPPPPM